MEVETYTRILGQLSNPEDSKLSDGLLQGKLLIDAVKAILKSPSSVLPLTSVRPGVAKRSRKGVAMKYHLSKITPAFLAYVVVIVQFALSSEDTFDDDSRTFNYTEFYWQLREYLEAPKYKKRAKALMNWWNQTLFPDSLHISDESEESGSWPGMLSLLDAKVKAEDDEEDEDET